LTGFNKLVVNPFSLHHQSLFSLLSHITFLGDDQARRVMGTVVREENALITALLRLSSRIQSIRARSIDMQISISLQREDIPSFVSLLR